VTALEPYAPARDIASKLGRKLTQWRAARPASLRFPQPLLSITFDDFPASAADAGARILELHGARATFYASAGLAGLDGPCGRNFSARDIARLVGAGHEIGCHTFAHADCARRKVFDLLEDLARNRDALEAMGAAPARTLAYPYGETTSRFKANLPPRFASARGTAPGLSAGRVDLAQLRALPFFGAGALQRLRRALKRAARRKAWLIAYTHDVSDAPSPWGTRTDDLDALLAAAHRLGFSVLPVTAALERRLA
jgi:peptidoglycan/xylan/chitin deacetylase (PgdA/CDA1 family)